MIFHFVPFMTGYEQIETFVSICGQDVTCSFFYTRLLDFTCMPVTRCRLCEDTIIAGVSLASLAIGAIVT